MSRLDPAGDVHEQKALLGTNSDTRLSNDQFQTLFGEKTFKHSDFRVGDIDTIRILIYDGAEDYTAFVENNPDILSRYNSSTAGKTKEEFGKTEWAAHLDSKKGNISSVKEYRMPMTGLVDEYVLKVATATTNEVLRGPRVPGEVLYSAEFPWIILNNGEKHAVVIPFGSTLEFEVTHINMGEKYQSYWRYKPENFQWSGAPGITGGKFEAPGWSNNLFPRSDVKIGRVMTTTGSDVDSHAFSTRWTSFDPEGTRNNIVFTIRGADTFNDHDNLAKSVTIPIKFGWSAVVKPDVNLSISLEGEDQSAPYIFCRASENDSVDITLTATLGSVTNANRGNSYIFNWKNGNSIIGTSSTSGEESSSITVSLTDPNPDLSVDVIVIGDHYGHEWEYTTSTSSTTPVSLVIGPSSASDSIYIGPIVPDKAEDIHWNGDDNTSLSLEGVSTMSGLSIPTHMISKNQYETINRWPAYEFNISGKQSPVITGDIREVTYTLEKYNNGGWTGSQKTIPNTSTIQPVTMARDGAAVHDTLIESSSVSGITSSAYRVRMDKNIIHDGQLYESVCSAYSPTIYNMVVESDPDSSAVNPEMTVAPVQDGTEISLKWTPVSEPVFNVGDKAFTLNVKQVVRFYDKNYTRKRLFGRSRYNPSIGTGIEDLSSSVDDISLTQSGEYREMFEAIEKHRISQRKNDKDVELFARVYTVWTGGDSWSSYNSSLDGIDLLGSGGGVTSDILTTYFPPGSTATGVSREYEWQSYAESNIKELLSCTDIEILDENNREISNDIIITNPMRMNDIIGVGGKTWSTVNDVIDLGGCRKYGYGFRVVNLNSPRPVLLTQQPSPDNSWTAIIDINDNELVGPNKYEFQLVCSYYIGTAYEEKILMTFSGVVDQTRRIEYQCVYDTSRTSYTGTDKTSGQIVSGATAKSIVYSDSSIDTGSYLATVTLDPFLATNVADMSATTCDSTYGTASVERAHKIFSFEGDVAHQMWLNFRGLGSGLFGDVMFSGTGNPPTTSSSGIPGISYIKFNNWPVGTRYPSGTPKHHDINIYPLNINTTKVERYYWKKVSANSSWSGCSFSCSGDINSPSSELKLVLYHNEGGEGYYNVEIYADVIETITTEV